MYTAYQTSLHFSKSRELLDLRSQPGTNSYDKNPYDVSSSLDSLSDSISVS